MIVIVNEGINVRDFGDVYDRNIVSESGVTGFYKSYLDDINVEDDNGMLINKVLRDRINIIGDDSAYDRVLVIDYDDAFERVETYDFGDYVSSMVIDEVSNVIEDDRYLRCGIYNESIEVEGGENFKHDKVIVERDDTVEILSDTLYKVEGEEVDVLDRSNVAFHEVNIDNINVSDEYVTYHTKVVEELIETVEMIERNYTRIINEISSIYEQIFIPSLEQASRTVYRLKVLRKMYDAIMGGGGK